MQWNVVCNNQCTFIMNVFLLVDDNMRDQWLREPFRLWVFKKEEKITQGTLPNLLPHYVFVYNESYHDFSFFQSRTSLRVITLWCFFFLVLCSFHFTLAENPGWSLLKSHFWAFNETKIGIIITKGTFQNR